MSAKDIALEYARDELGYKNPVVYGSQRDPKVVGCFAVWVREDSQMVFVGLIVSGGEVIDEFEPDAEHAPGKLKTGDIKFDIKLY